MAVPQTSYVEAQPVAYAGMKGDSGPDYVRSYFNQSGTATDFGLMVKQGTADNQFDKLSPGADALGALLHSHVWDPGLGNCQPASPGNILRWGRVWMLTENAVAANGAVYARHTSDGGSNTTLGKVRSNRDGTAQVDTFTPTVANDTTYTVHVTVDGKMFSFRVLSDGTATDAEIVTAFKVAMAADTAFTAYVVATGTTTLILTAVTAGLPFYAVDGGSAGIMTRAATTASATKADLVRGARFLTSTTGAGLALVELNLSQD